MTLSGADCVIQQRIEKAKLETSKKEEPMAEMAYREALRAALDEEMERDVRVFLMGEEVARYNGAYKVSQGLLEKYGSARVVDAPISELGFGGLGVGAAMAGLRPVIEMMTWNFAILAMDQIVNNAAKLRHMSGGQLRCPIVFRGPGGAGGRLSSQHSQALEANYAHFPGLKVLAPGTPADAKGLLKSAIRDENPVVFIEGELLYGARGDVPAGEHLVEIGKADVKRPGEDVTIITWSRMVTACVLPAAEALAAQQVDVEVVDLRSLKPFDEEAVRQSVKKTNRVLIVEEGWGFAGFGGHISDFIQRECFDFLDAPVQRVSGLDVNMAYAANLEREIQPNVERVVAAVHQLLYRDSVP
jgi:pyruvate dehydrogenase E1 component beta subunit